MADMQYLSPIKESLLPIKVLDTELYQVFKMASLTAVILCALATTALSQQTIYGQCGGLSESSMILNSEDYLVNSKQPGQVLLHVLLDLCAFTTIHITVCISDTTT